MMGWEIFNRSGRCVDHFTSDGGYFQLMQDVAKWKHRFPQFHQFLRNRGGDVENWLLQEIGEYISFRAGTKRWPLPMCGAIAADLLRTLKHRKFAKIDV